jgi:death on curing protein
MPDIAFLTLEDVLTLHDDAIAFAGGSSGVLSIDFLQGAIAQPEAGFGGEWANEFPFGMAAAYAYHLSRNHAFVDGNKRVGLSAAVVFLYLNGWSLMTRAKPFTRSWRMWRREKSRSPSWRSSSRSWRTSSTLDESPRPT